jgi:hypothetical protein
VIAAALLAGCTEKTKVIEKIVTETVVDKDLMLATCLLTLMPAMYGTRTSDVAVIQTADGKRYPWFVRDYQFLKPEELEAGMKWMKEGNALITGMFPSTFCKLDGPAFATIRLGNPGESTWLWSGEITALVKQEMKGTLDSSSADRGAELVVEALKKVGGDKPELVFLPQTKDIKSPSASGRWLDVFRKAAAK